MGYHDDGRAMGVCVLLNLCAVGYHNGGDSVCVPNGQCRPGYHDGGFGVCVANGQCSPGYHDDGRAIGVCVPQNQCASGYHNGGDGVCVPNGQCRPGYHDGGNGTCFVLGACAAGYHDGGDGTCIPVGQCKPGFLITPEGRCVFYAALRNLTSGSDRRVSYGPTFTADGKVVVFASNTDFMNEGVSETQFELWRLDVDSAKLTRLTRSAYSDRRSDQPSISADGKILVFRSDANFKDEGLSKGNFRIWVYRMDTGALERLSDVSSSEYRYQEPRISADGKKVLFRLGTADYEPSALYLETLATHARSTVVNKISRVRDAGGAQAARVSADGDKIVFLSDSDFLDEGTVALGSHVWLFTVSTGAYRRVTTEAVNANNLFPNISANGQRIAFASTADHINHTQRGPRVWSYDVSARTLQALTPVLGANAEHVSLSPDGSRVLFAETRTSVKRLRVYDFPKRVLNTVLEFNASYANNTICVSDDLKRVLFEGSGQFGKLPTSSTQVWLVEGPGRP